MNAKKSSSKENFLEKTTKKRKNVPRHGDKKSVPCRAVPCRGTKFFRCRAVPVPWKNLKEFPALPKRLLSINLLDG